MAGSFSGGADRTVEAGCVRGARWACLCGSHCTAMSGEGLRRERGWSRPPEGAGLVCMERDSVGRQAKGCCQPEGGVRALRGLHVSASAAGFAPCEEGFPVQAVSDMSWRCGWPPAREGGFGLADFSPLWVTPPHTALM
jgi:hypothetical protein